jgi:hypothetical protein
MAQLSTYDVSDELYNLIIGGSFSYFNNTDIESNNESKLLFESDNESIDSKLTNSELEVYGGSDNEYIDNTLYYEDNNENYQIDKVVSKYNNELFENDNNNKNENDSENENNSENDRVQYYKGSGLFDTEELSGKQLLLEHKDQIYENDIQVDRSLFENEDLEIFENLKNPENPDVIQGAKQNNNDTEIKTLASYLLNISKQ